MKPHLVIGLGNRLMGDEGVGCLLAERLASDPRLPVDIEGNPDIPALVSQYGPRMIGRVNFSTGRVRPNFSLDASLGADLWKQDKRSLRLQVAAENLSNRLNVINFAGLFSGTAVALPRSGNVRLQYEF